MQPEGRRELSAFVEGGERPAQVFLPFTFNILSKQTRLFCNRFVNLPPVSVTLWIAAIRLTSVIVCPPGGVDVTRYCTIP